MPLRNLSVKNFQVKELTSNTPCTFALWSQKFFFFFWVIKCEWPSRKNFVQDVYRLISFAVDPFFGSINIGTYWFSIFFFNAWCYLRTFKIDTGCSVWPNQKEILPSFDVNLALGTNMGSNMHRFSDKAISFGSFHSFFQQNSL